MLTHLLGQSIAEVSEKIALYREARADAGLDPETGEVCLMLHTYLADTRDQAREIARAPMKDYLRSAAGLIKQYAWAFPAFKKPQGVENPHQIDLGSLDDDELEGILDFAFERYFNDSGLFGTVDDAEARIADLKAIGVKEVACLIDYGIAPDVVLEGLKPLAEVIARVSGEDVPDDRDFSVAAQIRRHGATHLQCTPSLMRLMMADDGARAALRQLDHIFLGGEALPGPLVEALGQVTRAQVLNMYGPTETTIWSAVGPAQAVPGVVPIGAPIANTALYVLDEGGAPCAIGQPGELWIGGQGVARGYWQRDTLTQERFRPDPFAETGGRMYRTGDMVMRRADGMIDFLGRADGQVKLRGMRIELGEVEARIEALDGVTQAAAIVRDDRLLAFVTGTPGDETAMKATLAAGLPAHMVPGRIVTLDALPLTPNKKVDRNALPEPKAPAPASHSAAASREVAPQAVTAAPAPYVAREETGASRATLAELGDLWATTLGVGQVGAADNFFALGGHSLLAVELHRAIRDGMRAKEFSITDVFRFPTLKAMADRVAGCAAMRPHVRSLCAPRHARRKRRRRLRRRHACPPPIRPRSAIRVPMHGAQPWPSGAKCVPERRDKPMSSMPLLQMIKGLGDAWPDGVAVAVVDPEQVTEPLFPIEEAAVSRAVAGRRAEFAAGRQAARQALKALGYAPVAIPMAEDRAPVWPQGIVGSLSHCPAACIAVVAEAARIASLGVDIEPYDPLPEDIVHEIGARMKSRASAPTDVSPRGSSFPPRKPLTRRNTR